MIDANTATTTTTTTTDAANLNINLNKKIALGQTLSYLCLFCLLATYLVTSLLDEHINWTTLLVPCFSLLIFLPGLLQKKPRSYNWLCFVLLIHFTMGVSNAMSAHAAWNDYLQTLLSIILFIAAMMTSRWLQAREQL